MLHETQARLAELVREHVRAESSAPAAGIRIRAGNASPMLVGSHNNVTVNVTCPLALEMLRLLATDISSA